MAPLSATTTPSWGAAKVGSSLISRFHNKESPRIGKPETNPFVSDPLSEILVVHSQKYP
jgi:hypothetical protein